MPKTGSTYTTLNYSKGGKVPHHHYPGPSGPKKPLHWSNILRAEYGNRHGLEARYRKNQHLLNPRRICKSVIDDCDIPTKATSITKKYGLPREITKSQSAHLFGRNIAPDTPIANRVIELSNTPTANKFTKLPTKTNRTKEHNHRDH